MKRFEGYLKGVNLGGWISQFSEYNKEHFETFITEKDIKEIASLGFDHVRVPVDYNVLEDENANIIESGFNYLENCRKWCEKEGLNMLIDLHECYGYSFDPLKEDMDRKKFFYDEELQNRFFNLWKEIAIRFAPYYSHVAFEPLNEVVLLDVKDAWNKILTKYIKMIRSLSPETYIVAGGVCYNNVLTVSLLDIPVDDKIVFNFHCYEPLVFTHQGAYWQCEMPSDFRISYPKTLSEYKTEHIKIYNDNEGALFKEGIREIGQGFFEDIFAPAIEKAEKENVALYCGEYGVIDLADNDSKFNWLKDISKAFNKYQIGHALWNYKEKDFGFTGEKFAPLREKLLKEVFD